MNHKLSVVVHVDLEETYCHLLVTGCLTEVNQQALHPLIRRARALPPGVRVMVDLTAARLSDGSALELLRCTVGNDDVSHRAAPVQFLTSDPISSEAGSLPRASTADLAAAGTIPGTTLVPEGKAVS